MAAVVATAIPRVVTAVTQTVQPFPRTTVVGPLVEELLSRRVDLPVATLALVPSDKVVSVKATPVAVAVAVVATTVVVDPSLQPVAVAHPSLTVHRLPTRRLAPILEMVG